MSELLRTDYVKEVNEYNESMKKLLSSGFAMSSEEVFEFLC